MLFHIKFHIDQQSLGFGELRTTVAAAEGERAVAARKDGRLKALWRRADGGGAIFVIDMPSNEELAAFLQSLPLYPYLRQIEVTPLVPHPSFLEYAPPEVE
jgi:muconolactone D-isomerase